jgi:hypothetical protein
MSCFTFPIAGQTGGRRGTHAEVAPAAISAILREAPASASIEVSEEALRIRIVLGGLEGTLDPGRAAQGKPMPFEEADDPRRPGPVGDENAEPSARREVVAGSFGLTVPRAKAYYRRLLGVRGYHEKNRKSAQTTAACCL